MTVTITLPDEIAERLAPYSETECAEYVADLFTEAWHDAERHDARLEAAIHAGAFDALAAEAQTDRAAGRIYHAPPYPPRTPITLQKPMYG